jgi:hypothetical protein
MTTAAEVAFLGSQIPSLCRLDLVTGNSSERVEECLERGELVEVIELNDDVMSYVLKEIRRLKWDAHLRREHSFSRLLGSCDHACASYPRGPRRRRFTLLIVGRTRCAGHLALRGFPPATKLRFLGHAAPLV